jgi:hypothetical protein
MMRQRLRLRIRDLWRSGVRSRVFPLPARDRIIPKLSEETDWNGEGCSPHSTSDLRTPLSNPDEPLDLAGREFAFVLPFDRVFQNRVGPNTATCGGIRSKAFEPWR